MPIEVEAKLRVASHEPVRRRLRSLGATPLGCVMETNRIFDRPDGSLRRTGCGLRIRSTVTSEPSVVEAAEGRPTGKSVPQTGKSRAMLTFKGPVVPGPFKSREELEVQVSDAETAARMLTKMGFARILWYRKRRESWRLDACRIELDEPPHIGLFVEIEGDNEEAVARVRKKLGLGAAPHVPASYVRMLHEYCQKHGVTDRTLDLPDRSSADS